MDPMVAWGLIFVGGLVLLGPPFSCSGIDSGP